MVKYYLIIFIVVHIIIFYIYVNLSHDKKIYQQPNIINVTDDNIYTKQKLLKLKDEHYSNIIYENKQFNKYIMMETLRVKQKILYLVKNTKKNNNNLNFYVNNKLHIFNLKNDDLEDESMEMACDIIHKNLLKIFVDSEIIRSKGRHQHPCYFIFKW